MENKTISFSTDVWQILLRPAPTFDTRSKFESCFKYWCGMDEAKRTRVYELILHKKQAGLFVHPNPRLALDDAAQEDEVLQAKAKASKKKEPEDLNGKYKIDSILKETRVVSAVYRGLSGIYTLAEAEQFGLEIKYGMNFNYEQYLKEKNNDKYQ